MLKKQLAYLFVRKDACVAFFQMKITCLVWFGVKLFEKAATIGVKIVLGHPWHTGHRGTAHCTMNSYKNICQSKENSVYMDELSQSLYFSLQFSFSAVPAFGSTVAHSDMQVFQ